MPELPEVEVTRLGLVDRIRGSTILNVQMGKPLRWALGCEPDTLVGATVLDVRRRGKYLLFDLDRFGVLLVHLGMSGSLGFDTISARGPCALSALGRHDHFEMVTTRGILRLNDPRRFGAVVWVANVFDPRAAKLLGRLGVEPLAAEFLALPFHQKLKSKKAPIKQVLLAGEIVVGVGNIYASEALFMAAIHPRAAASSLSLRRATRLHAAIVEVLQLAVEKGGSTLRDFSNAQGESGYFQLTAMVYGRAGEPCKRCGATVKMLRQGQRSSFFCPVCQKR